MQRTGAVCQKAAAPLKAIGVTVSEESIRVLLCKQAAKIFQTICKKETALKRVLRNLLSAISFAQI